jgi:hypothetical protein
MRSYLILVNCVWLLCCNSVSEISDLKLRLGISSRHADSLLNSIGYVKPAEMHSTWYSISTRRQYQMVIVDYGDDSTLVMYSASSGSTHDSLKVLEEFVRTSQALTKVIGAHDSTVYSATLFRNRNFPSFLSYTRYWSTNGEIQAITRFHFIERGQHMFSYTVSKPNLFQDTNGLSRENEVRMRID